MVFNFWQPPRRRERIEPSHFDFSRFRQQPRPISWFALFMGVATGWNATFAALWGWHRGVCRQSVICGLIALVCFCWMLLERRKAVR